MNRNHFWIVGTIVLLMATALAACQPATQVVDTAALEAEATSSAPQAEVISMEDATTTDSGLQYLELTPGSGRTPAPGDLVSMHAVISLPDGTEIANSLANGQPISVVLGRNELLPGWEEGLALMQVGGKAQMVLPPELAFGEQGYGAIQPNSQIVLEVELLSAEEPPQPSQVAEADLTTTDSGLKYYDLTEGDGAEAAANSSVTANFTVWVAGEGADTFVMSSPEGQPATFVVGRGDTGIAGWDEGMTGMKVGGKRLLVIPPELALGDQASNTIPANSTLIMEVELTDVREPIKMSEVDPADYTTTESGLQYYDLVEGTGDTPQSGQTVVVHYTGWLEDGTQFDSSVEGGQPFSFVLGQGGVIPGWDEGVATMKVGGKRQLRIPAELAYGEAGSGGVIPPGATLIFDIELLEIQP